MADEELVKHEKSKVEVKRRTISPYDLSVSDNPGCVISNPFLLGPNYDEWSSNLAGALKARKKFGFVDGSIPKPDADSEDLEDWWTNNALLVSWIKLTIDPVLSSNISHYDVAKDLWDHIQQRFAIKNGQRVQRLKTEIANCRQQGLAIEAYYGKLTKLWTSLGDYQKGRTIEEIEREREEDKLHQFLMRVDETLFGSVKSSLLSRTPLPSVDEAYNVLTQDEQSKANARLQEKRATKISFAIQEFK